MVIGYMARAQWPRKNLSFPPAQSLFFQLQVKSEGQCRLGVRDFSVAVISINLWGNFFFSPTSHCESLPQNDTQ